MEDEDGRGTFESVIKAEERVKLIRAMMKAGVGFPEVESFVKRQSQHCRGGRHEGQKKQ